MNQQDKQFLQDVYSDGIAEVELGRLAEQKTRNEDVVAFAQRMIHDHSQANEEVRQLANHLGIQLENKIKDAKRQKKDELQLLDGQAFNRAYIRSEIEGHEKAVQMAQQCTEQAQGAQIRGFAEKAVSLLGRHLELARQTEQALQRQEQPRAS